MKPMMWMGKLSAIAAFAMGALFAGFAVMQWSWGAPGWQLMLAAALLMIGAVRGLTGMSGGLRLLCGAWGLSAGLTLAPHASALQPASTGHLTVNTIAGLLIIAAPLISLAGLALTVLHSERR